MVLTDESNRLLNPFLWQWQYAANTIEQFGFIDNFQHFDNFGWASRWAYEEK